MFPLIIQTLLLLAIAFILGCIVGCLLRNLFGSAEPDTTAAATATGVGAVAASVASAAAPKSIPPQQPVVPKPPMPTAPVQPVETAKIATPPAALVPKTPEKPAPVKPKATTPKASATSTKKAPAKKRTVVAKSEKDNLKLIRGIGPQNEGRLNALGVSTFAVIAKWTKKDQAHFGEALAFPGRIEREDWVGQAKVLAKGGATDFAKRVKSGSVSSSVGVADKGDMGTKPKGMLKAPKGGNADNLTLIDGVGNAIEKKMFNLGIYHFDQVAKMSKSELVWLGNSVGFPGRPERENWAGEAKVLAAGGTTNHAKKVEKGQIKTSRKS